MNLFSVPDKRGYRGVLEKSGTDGTVSEVRVTRKLRVARQGAGLPAARGTVPGTLGTRDKLSFTMLRFGDKRWTELKG